MSKLFRNVPGSNSLEMSPRFAFDFDATRRIFPDQTVQTTDDRASGEPAAEGVFEPEWTSVPLPNGAAGAGQAGGRISGVGPSTKGPLFHPDGREPEFFPGAWAADGSAS